MSRRRGTAKRLGIAVVSLLLWGILASGVASATQTAWPYVVVNGRNILPAGSRAPHYHGNHIYAPLGAVAEALGVQWSFDPTTSRATLDGKPFDAAGYTPAIHLHENVVYAPVRAVAEAVGARVEWDAVSGAVFITGGPRWREGPSGADALTALWSATTSGRVQVVDLSAPLSEATPVIQLPPPFANTPTLRRHTVSAFDEKGPAWQWYWFDYSEHIGSHLDAPCHWITGRDRACLDNVPGQLLIGPAVILDITDKASANPDYLATVEDLAAWENRNGRIPEHAWVLLRSGWSRFAGTPKYINADEKGPHTPGFSVDLIQELIRRNILGVGVETIGIDAGQAGSFDPPFPVHYHLLGSGRFGLTQLINLDRLPEKGALLIAAAPRLVGGTGSPMRALALVPADDLSGQKTER